MVITISREYGAGGRTIAKGLAQELGLEYYDVDFVRLTAKVSGYSEEDIRREGEEMSSGAKWINQLLDNMSSYSSSYDAIFRAQREVVLELAKKPCIIIGRCSNIILREMGIPSFDIFLYGDMKYRTEYCLNVNNESGISDAEEMEKYIEKRDHLRRTYYKTFTKHEMGNYRDYNICLDIGTVGMQNAVGLLTEILKDKI